MGDVLCLVIVLLIILILWCQRPKEHFDTYNNHDIGALNVYQNEQQPIDTISQAALKAKYQWSERDAAGDTVYDKMYDAVLKEKNYGDVDYAYRDIDHTDLVNVYDTKFSVLDNENELANYKISDMHDPYIIQNIINGQKISLAQKQY